MFIADLCAAFHACKAGRLISVATEDETAAAAFAEPECPLSLTYRTSDPRKQCVAIRARVGKLLLLLLIATVLVMRCFICKTVIIG